MRTVLMSTLSILASAAAAQAQDVDYAAEIMQADRDFSAYAKAHSISEAFGRYMDQVDGRLLRGRGDPIRGEAAIRENFAGYAPELILHWEPEEAFASQAGDFGMSWGWYYVYRDGNMDRAPDDRGKYVTVWRRNDAGEWRGLLDMGTRDGSYQPPDQQDDSDSDGSGN